MRCPSCLTPLEESAPACPTCGFTLATLDRKFGTVPKVDRFVTDFVPYFSARESARLEGKIARLERSFPGLYVSVITMEVRSLFSPREYLFWLMNRCRFSPTDCRLERSFAVVLFFDATSRQVLLTTGYALEATLPEPILANILERALPYFKGGNFYGGTRRILVQLRRHLKKSSSETESTRRTRPESDLSPLTQEVVS